MVCDGPTGHRNLRIPHGRETARSPSDEGPSRYEPAGVAIDLVALGHCWTLEVQSRDHPLKNGLHSFCGSHEGDSTGGGQYAESRGKCSAARTERSGITECVDEHDEATAERCDPGCTTSACREC